METGPTMRVREKLAMGFAVVFFAFLGGFSLAWAGSPFALETGDTSVPYGWVGFCNRYIGECDEPALTRVDIPFTAAMMKTLEAVTIEVNQSIEPMTDMDHWGVVDQWDYPYDGRGDCEDYALMKRKILMDKGFPRQALLMTVVKDRAGDGHAILTVKTSKADYVLDNMSDRVIRWDETGYRFMKRQAQEDQNRWVSLNAADDAPLFTAR